MKKNLESKLARLPKFEKPAPKERVKVAPQPKAVPKRVASESKERSPPNVNYKMPERGSRFMQKSSMPSLGMSGSSQGFKPVDVISEDDDEKLAEAIDSIPKRQFSPKGGSAVTIGKRKPSGIPMLNPIDLEK
jgi:hypothetical protein